MSLSMHSRIWCGLAFVAAGLSWASAGGPAERMLTLGAPPGDTTADFQLSLRPRGEALAAPVETARTAAPAPSRRGAAIPSAASEGATPEAAAASGRGRGGRGNGERP